MHRHGFMSMSWFAATFIHLPPIKIYVYFIKTSLVNFVCYLLMSVSFLFETAPLEILNDSILLNDSVCKLTGPAGSFDSWTRLSFHWL